MKRKNDYIRTQNMAINARKYPAMFVGSAEEGHLWIIRQILYVVCLTPVFDVPIRIKLNVDNCKFCIQVWSCGLKGKYSDNINLKDHHDFINEIDKLSKSFDNELNTVETVHAAQGHYISLISLVAAIPLADLSIIGIHAFNSFWWQKFVHGIPESHIQTMKQPLIIDSKKIGLYIFNDLSRDVLYNLPYRIEEVRRYLSNIPCNCLEIDDNLTEDINLRLL